MKTEHKQGRRVSNQTCQSPHNILLNFRMNCLRWNTGVQEILVMYSLVLLLFCAIPQSALTFKEICVFNLCKEAMPLKVTSMQQCVKFIFMQYASYYCHLCDPAVCLFSFANPM